jgi:hypothetical protein
MSSPTTGNRRRDETSRWRRYESMKAELAARGLTAAEYDAAIRRLVAKLGL